ncbi:D-Ala-D-Ala carboxypeptidase family metallohydrolase [Echinicola sp. 20G]|uniref:YcbK family protein n=1 Tax=Echinicola sp. 20G TaxID=2781961 RepID=UPI0019106DD0|nr:D-Ala-D-Ala carboxypeptidase family metallohydrolase [Echinicola sp. 20G]
MKLTKNFSLDEFKSKDGVAFPICVTNNLKELAESLQVLRDELGKPIYINSGYRSPDHNKAIGGAKNSYHLKGMAADIKVGGITPQGLLETVLRLKDEGKIKVGGLGVYDSFLHFDIRPDFLIFKK